MQLEVLQHVHADGDLRGDLDTGAAQFGVAHLQKRAGNAHGEVETGALGDELVVHVAAVVAHEAIGRCPLVWRGADDADHGVDGEAHAVEVGHAALDLDLLRAVIGALEQRTAMVVSGDGALVGHLDVVDVHDEHVAHFSAFHVHRAGGGVGDVVGEVHVLHGDGFVGQAAREAVERVELQHLARLGGVARRIVLRECVPPVFDDLHGFLLCLRDGATPCRAGFHHTLLRLLVQAGLRGYLGRGDFPHERV